MPSQATSPGAAFFPVKVRTEPPPSSRTRNDHASTPEVTRSVGRNLIRSFTPSPFGEKTARSVATITGVASVSMRTATGAEVTVLPARSVDARV